MRDHGGGRLGTVGASVQVGHYVNQGVISRFRIGAF